MHRNNVHEERNLHNQRRKKANMQQILPSECEKEEVDRAILLAATCCDSTICTKSAIHMHIRADECTNSATERAKETHWQTEVIYSYASRGNPRKIGSLNFLSVVFFLPSSTTQFTIVLPQSFFSSFRSFLIFLYLCMCALLFSVPAWYCRQTI